MVLRDQRDLAKRTLPHCSSIREAMRSSTQARRKAQRSLSCLLGDLHASNSSLGLASVSPIHRGCPYLMFGLTDRHYRRPACCTSLGEIDHDPKFISYRSTVASCGSPMCQICRMFWCRSPYRCASCEVSRPYPEPATIHIPTWIPLLPQIS